MEYIWHILLLKLQGSIAFLLSESHTSVVRISGHSYKPDITGDAMSRSGLFMVDLTAAVGPTVIGAGTRHLPPSRIHAPVTNPR